MWDLASAGADVKTRTFGGTAICDFLEQMRADASELEPDAVVIEFSGNALTPCVSSAAVEQGRSRGHLPCRRRDGHQHLPGGSDLPRGVAGLGAGVRGRRCPRRCDGRPLPGDRCAGCERPVRRRRRRGARRGPLDRDAVVPTQRAMRRRDRPARPGGERGASARRRSLLPRREGSAPRRDRHVPGVVERCVPLRLRHGQPVVLDLTTAGRS